MLEKLRSFFHHSKEPVQEPKHTPTQEELDAIKMKTIVLLKEKGMYGTPLHQLLKGTPKVKIGIENHVTITQIFEWAKKEYQVEGKFLRKKGKSIPLRDTFKITSIPDTSIKMPFPCLFYKGEVRCKSVQRKDTSS